MTVKSANLSALYSKKVAKPIKYKPNSTNLVTLATKTPKKRKNR